MSKYVLILLTTLLFGCLPEKNDVVANVYGVEVYERTITKDNHTYYMFVMRGAFKGGLAVVHSEACQCKKRKQKGNNK
jgi:hypothetical protein